MNFTDFLFIVTSLGIQFIINFLICFIIFKLSEKKILGISVPILGVAKILGFAIGCYIGFAFLARIIIVFIFSHFSLPNSVTFGSTGIGILPILHVMIIIISIIIFWISFKKILVKEGLDEGKAKQFSEHVIKYMILTLFVLSFLYFLIQSM